jgi:hypothetical protein
VNATANAGLYTLSGEIAARKDLIAGLQNEITARKQLASEGYDETNALVILNDALNQQKDLLDKLSHENPYETMISSLKSMADLVGKFTEGESNRYLSAAMKDLTTSTGTQVINQEMSTIQLLQQEVDLKQQSADIDAQANLQVLNIQRGLGIARGVTAGQSAASQIRDIQAQQAKQQTAVQQQLALVQAQIGAAAALYGIDLNNLTLQQQRTLLLNQEVNLQTQLTAQSVLQAQALIAIYNQLKSGNVTLPAGVLPVYNPVYSLPSGSGYTINGEGGGAPVTINGGITVNYSGAADPAALAAAIQAAITQINFNKTVGVSGA